MTTCTSEIELGGLLQCTLEQGHEGLHTNDGISWANQAGTPAPRPGWVLKVQHLDGTTDTEQYDHDEQGTMEDKLLGLFITDLDGIDQITLARQLPGWQ